MTSPLSFAVSNTYYATPALRAAVFKVLERVMPSRSGPGLSNEDRHRKADPRLGRPGMEQWKILVLGVLRLGLNSDYDRIHELANHHDTIRQMLGHGGWEDKTTYNRQTIKDNLRLFTPEILDEINQLVVKAGHGLVKKNVPKAGPTRIRTEKKIGKFSIIWGKTHFSLFPEVPSWSGLNDRGPRINSTGSVRS